MPCSHPARRAAAPLLLTLAAAPALANPPAYSTPMTDAFFAASADLNADGHADIVGVGADGLSVLLGRADGTFDPPVSYPPHPAAPTISLAVDDLNADGAPDVVVTGFSPQGSYALFSIVVFLNDGAGGFDNATEYAPDDVPNGPTPNTLIADFTGDGAPDIITHWDAALGTAVLINNGDGTFAAPTVSAGVDPLLATELSGDGAADLVSGDNNHIVISRSLADGTFEQTDSFEFDRSSRPIRAADIDNDGDTDLIATGNRDRLLILRNHGTAHFTPEIYAHQAANVANIANLNPDNAPDIVLAGESGPVGLASLVNQGEGRFDAPRLYPTENAASFTTGDVDSDGDQDLLVIPNTVGTTHSLRARLNDGTGLLGPAQTIAVHPDRPADPGEYVNAVAVADLDNDGTNDLLAIDVRDRVSGLVELRALLGGPTPTSVGIYQLPDYCPGGSCADYAPPRDVIATDLDNDGDFDVTVVDSRLLVYLNDGLGNLTLQQNLDVEPSDDHHVVADVNLDGVPDVLVAASSSVRILLGLGDGTFAAPTDVTVPNYFYEFVGADVTGDDAPDLILAESGAIQIFNNDGAGAFPAVSKTISLSTFVGGLAVSDADHDGDLDIWIPTAQTTDHGLSVLLNLNNGQSFHRKAVAETAAGFTITAADMNADGIPDVLSGLGNDDSLHHVTLFTAHPDATVNIPIGDEQLQNLMYPVLRDFTGDGVTDILATSNATLLLQGQGNGTFAPSAHSFLLPLSSDATPDAADFNEDGLLDVLTRDGALLLSQGTPGDFRSFLAPFSPTLPGASNVADVGDLDADGLADALVRESGVGPLSVYHADGLGCFAKASTLDDTCAQSTLIADVTGDNRPDILFFDPCAADLRAFANLGNDQFTPAWDTPLVLPTHLSAADLNADGFKDIVADNEFGPEAFVLLNDAGHAFNVTTLTPDPIAHTRTRIGDIDGDGDPDLLVLAAYVPDDRLFYPYFNNGDGTFQPAPPLDYAFQGDDFSLIDVDHDGRADLLYVDGIDLTLRRAEAADTFGPPEILATGSFIPTTYQLADVTGDGHRDLVGVSYKMLVLPGVGHGTFAAPESYYAGPFDLFDEVSVRLVNIDDDGALDVAAFRPDSSVHSLYLSLNRLPPPPPPCQADFNHDGATDVFDFHILVTHFAQSVPPGANGDADGDGVVNVFDFAIFAANFGCTP